MKIRSGSLTARMQLSLVGIATASVLLAGCGSSDTTAGPSSGSGSGQSALLQAILDRGYAVAGIYDSPPDSTVADGSPTGLFPDLDVAVLKDLGISDVRGTLSDFAGLAPGLQSKKTDMVSGAFYITPERCRVMKFGNPIAVNTYAFITAEGKPTFRTWDDIKKAGAKVAIENGTYQQQIALKSLEQSSLLSVTSRQGGIDAINTGHADVYVAPTRIMTVLREEHKETYEVTQTDDIPALGVALAVLPENAAFIDEYNKAWDTVFNNGEAKSIMQKYGVDYDQFMEERSQVYTCSD